MSISGVSAQASQVTSLMSSVNSSNISTNITASDPTVLATQQQQLTNQLTQLQGKNGSPQEIQKIQQAIETIKNKLQQQDKLAEEKKASIQLSPTVLSNQNILSRNRIDIKA